MSIQQVEIVKPPLTIPDFIGSFVGGIFGLAVRVFFVWWAVAVWFPQFGLTYWQLALPVYALRALITPVPQYKQLTK